LQKAGGVGNEQAGSSGGSAPKPRILVVEDEPFIAILLADMLEELGFAITATFPHVTEAQNYLASADIDIALLDVNLGDEKIDPIADLLAERGRPFIFTTGYGRRGIPQNYADRPVLQKPFQLEDLDSSLKALLDAQERPPKS